MIIKYNILLIFFSLPLILLAESIEETSYKEKMRLVLMNEQENGFSHYGLYDENNLIIWIIYLDDGFLSFNIRHDDVSYDFLYENKVKNSSHTRIVVNSKDNGLPVAIIMFKKRKPEMMEKESLLYERESRKKTINTINNFDIHEAIND